MRLKKIPMKRAAQSDEGEPARRKAGSTIADVARLAGVSTATAGRVLGGYGYSSVVKKDKVLAAAKELGYRPNLLARSLITGRTKTIGVVAGDIQSPFYSTILRGISDVAESRGIGVLITNSDESREREVKSVRILLEKQVDGLILSPCSLSGGEHLDAVVASNTPVVQIDRQARGLKGDFVGVSNRASAREAISRLLALGHRRIGVVGELRHSRISIAKFVERLCDQIIDTSLLDPSWQRLHGYIDAHQEAGVPVDAELVRPADSYSVEAAAIQANSLLSQRNRPTALFTTDGLMTAGVMAAISSAGIMIPRDLSLICFDDLDWMAFMPPGIDAIAQPRGAMGEAAARMLLDRIEGKDMPFRRLIMSPHLVERGSAAAPFR